MADRFEDLRTFLTVISAGGVSAAANELGVAKSAVSRRISDLERRLGTALLDRSNRRPKLTPAGSEYARRAKAVLASLEDLDGSVAPGAKPRVITLSARPALLTRVVIPMARIVHPLLAADQLLLHLAAREEDLDDGSADVIVSGREMVGGMIGRSLFQTTCVLCASPAHLATYGVPADPRELDHHPAISFAGHERLWQLGDDNREIAKISLTCDDVDVAATAAIAGMGLAQLPDYVVAAALADGRLIQVLAGRRPRPTDVQAFHRVDAPLQTLRLVDALVAGFGATAWSSRLVGNAPGEPGN